MDVHGLYQLITGVTGGHQETYLLWDGLLASAGQSLPATLQCPAVNAWP